MVFMAGEVLSITTNDLPAEARNLTQTAAGSMVSSPQTALEVIPEVSEPEEILKIRFVLSNMKDIAGTRAGDVFFLRPTAKRVLTYFSYKWALFLRELSKVSFVDACGTFNIDPQAAMNFLNRPAVKEWFMDRFDKLLESEAYDPLAWRIQALDNFKSDSMSMVQYKQWENFGDRFEPKPSRNGTSEGGKIEININPVMLEKAFERQKAIEAELVK